MVSRSWRSSSWLGKLAFLFAILQVLLYTGVMPLWDGFDEPFHYAYLQTLSNEGRFPRLGESHLSDEVWTSLQYVPVSHIVKQNLPSLSSMEEFLKFSPSKRRWLRARLWNVEPTGQQGAAANPANYEAQQAPLAYLLLAPLDWLASGIPIVVRVLLLRVVASLAALALSSWALFRLAREIGLEPRFTWWAWLVMVTTQMYWGATAHVANDWLAVGLFPLVILAAVRCFKYPEEGNILLLWLAFAAAALTKAYFLALLPGVVWLVARGIRKTEISPGGLIGLTVVGGVPLLAWYGRNWMHYGSIAGLQDVVQAVPLQAKIAILPTVLSPAALLAAARAALWTGNSAFSSFSAGTQHLQLGLLGVIVVWSALKVWREGGFPRELGVVMAAMALHGTALLYAQMTFVALSGQAAMAATPWYATPLFAPFALLLGYLGSRGGGVGRWLLTLAAVLWLYAFLLTYWAKLIPYYGGFGGGRGTLTALWRWYRSGGAGAESALGQVAITPGGVVVWLAAIVSVLAVAICWAICGKVLRGQGLSAGPGSPEARRG